MRTSLVAFLVFILLAGALYVQLSEPVSQEEPSPRRRRVTLPSGGFYIPDGMLLNALPPQKVVELPTSNGTRDTYQQKVLYYEGYFFVCYFHSGSVKEMRYKSSADGLTWGQASTLSIGSFVKFPYGSFDFTDWRYFVSAYDYPNLPPEEADAVLCYTGSDGGTINIECHTIVDGTVTRTISDEVAVAASYGGTLTQGGTNCPNFDGNVYILWHRGEPSNRLHIQRFGKNAPGGGFHILYDEISHGEMVTGGQQLLPYKTSSPYSMLALAQDAEDVLYWNVYNTTGWENSHFTSLVTLAPGFSTFAGASEAMTLGAPERVHLVYVKASGVLVHRLFDGTWSDETILVSSGVSYPVIALGDNGERYVFFVKDNQVWLKYYNGRWYREAPFLTQDHTYSDPVYLSTNRNAQDGAICVMWTENVESSSEVWFSYMDVST